MKKNIILASVISTFTIGLSQEAKASFFEFVGGSPFITSSNNDYSKNWFGMSNQLSNLSLKTTTPNLSLTFEFLFRENTVQTLFSWNGSNPNYFLNISLPNNTIVSSLSIPTFYDNQIVPGLLNFSFFTELNSGIPLKNGDSKINIVNSKSYYSFFISFNDPLSSEKNNFFDSTKKSDIVWIAFDDGGVFKNNLPDLDYDDMIIKITAKPLPKNINEPNVFTIFGLMFFLIILSHKNFRFNDKITM
ncbi:MAG: hypothetical protein NZZ41_00600 [Candidatus Dojkabacteria bacterium]|nr:hypothetical protein [Candidatus Dojkabacteria bacterium]